MATFFKRYRRQSASVELEKQRELFEQQQLKVGGSEPTSMSTQPLAEQCKNIDSYELMRTLGTGSFGRVLLGRDKQTRAWVAVKVLKKERIVKTKQVEHVLQEKNILATVSCPFIVNMAAWFKDTRSLYIVLDFVNGGEMFTHLHHFGRFPTHVAKFYAAEVALGLEYLHNLDIIYRDLKPENLLLDAKGHVRITDFGFAKRVYDRTWTLCGTPEYLAPEIILSKGYSHAVDWWALGILLFEMMTGHAPFTDPNPMGIYEKIVQGTIDFPKHFHADETDLIRKLCTADLTRRLGNMKDGAGGIKTHPFFKSINFDALYAGKVDPPYVPKVVSDGDASNFDQYQEEQIQGLAPIPDPYDELFKEF
ncbi:protein kinase subunit [Capsaspora owczarzaki ATCC 30864]|uniref:cAMP-dependent protein kinase n=1 Tax=Capsaspora owczarzaki (strain ATCC 30864) TaxID=595528 RepID=A0A0D2U9I2_CAPO3|nr:protein kinase subunit [Capsaspora owczarzaki ATCC 30864]KJE91736.1 AGC/PKA protein kinase, variant [Capsaspora owczarzaki ATCC 30864]|eukprot:XP_004348643.1 protein kinase subunit [Capsaspora owczarzaki ATCC 30864]